MFQPSLPDRAQEWGYIGSTYCNVYIPGPKFQSLVGQVGGVPLNRFSHAWST